MRGVWTVARKDLRQRLRDRSAYVIGIVAPLVLATLMGAQTLGTTSEDLAYDFAFVNEDGGERGAAFGAVLAALDDEGVIKLRVVDRVAANRLVDANAITAAIVAPAGFSAEVDAGQATTLEVIANPEDETGSQVAEAFARSFANEVSAVSMSVQTALDARTTPVDEATIPTLVERALDVSSPALLARAEAPGAGVGFAAHISFGMAVFFLFFTVQFGVLSLIDERVSGTMARLVAAPIRRSSILAGKAFGSFVLGVASVAVLVVATSLPPLETDWGNLAGVALLTVAGVLAAVGIVALIGGFARNSEEATGYSMFAAVVLGLLGGAFFPVGLATGTIERASLLTPHRWLIGGYRELSAGGSAADVLPAVGIVLLFALVAGSIGLFRFRTLTRSP